jgi:uncharacterized protein (DUF1330 family)
MWFLALHGRSWTSLGSNKRNEATMKTRQLVGLSILAGAALGGGAVQTLHAQSKPPVYFVAEVAEISDPVGWSALGNRTTAVAAQLFKDFGGQYVARTDRITPLDGQAPKRLIVVRFDSAEQAKGWYNSPTQTKVNEIRQKTTKSHAYLVEGL